MDYLTIYYKNLSEQFQEQINILTKLLNESTNDMSNPRNIHNEIGSHILNLHVNKFPHKSGKKESFDDFEMKYDTHPDAPFTDPTKALEAMSPYIMQGNRDFQQHVRETLNINGGEYSHPDIDTLTDEHIGDFGAHIENLMNNKKPKNIQNPGDTDPNGKWEATDPRR